MKDKWDNNSVKSRIQSTGTVKKVYPRLRELAPATRGGQEEGSRNLDPAFFTNPVFADGPISLRSITRQYFHINSIIVIG